jgi:hypothetical protein
VVSLHVVHRSTDPKKQSILKGLVRVAATAHANDFASCAILLRCEGEGHEGADRRSVPKAVCRSRRHCWPVKSWTSSSLNGRVCALTCIFTGPAGEKEESKSDDVGNGEVRNDG